jgi:hypothetical protein
MTAIGVEEIGIASRPPVGRLISYADAVWRVTAVTPLDLDDEDRATSTGSPTGVVVGVRSKGIRDASRGRGHDVRPQVVRDRTAPVARIAMVMSAIAAATEGDRVA